MGVVMFRWLTRYVKKVTIFGVGIEFREIPESEALPLLEAAKTQRPAVPAEPGPSQPPPATAPKTETSESADLGPPVVERQDYICLTGCSASAQRAPRELDLRLDGEDIEFHVHNPRASQPKMWVKRADLQKALDRWRGLESGAEPIKLPGRTVRKAAEVVLVVDEEEEAEVQAGWWIWVSRQDLKGALEALGLRVPW